MKLKRWIHRIRRRRTIEITGGGKWFLSLTILFGVAAVLSANSVLYLLESLLLGTLVLSGLLSDRMLWNLQVRWQEIPAHAGGPIPDRIRVINRSRIPAVAIELGEWTEKGFQLRAYLPYLAPRSQAEASWAGSPYPSRGLHEWTGKVLATRFPFGFARKIRWIAPDGSRWIRPRLFQPQDQDRQNSNPSAQGQAEYEEGFLRPFTPGDDHRDIAWVYSPSLKGPHHQRVRSNRPESLVLKLETRGLDPASLERHLSELATQLVHAREQDSPVELEIPSLRGGSRTVDEVESCLDLLAREERA